MQYLRKKNIVVSLVVHFCRQNLIPIKNEIVRGFRVPSCILTEEQLKKRFLLAHADSPSLEKAQVGTVDLTNSSGFYPLLCSLNLLCVSPYG